MLEESEQLLAVLMQREKDSTEMLIHRRDRTQQEIQGISEGARVHEAYRDSYVPTTHRRLDVGQ